MIALPMRSSSLTPAVRTRLVSPQMRSCLTRSPAPHEPTPNHPSYRLTLFCPVPVHPAPPCLSTPHQQCPTSSQPCPTLPHPTPHCFIPPTPPHLTSPHPTLPIPPFPRHPTPPHPALPSPRPPLAPPAPHPALPSPRLTSSPRSLRPCTVTSLASPASGAMYTMAGESGTCSSLYLTWIPYSPSLDT